MTAEAVTAAGIVLVFLAGCWVGFIAMAVFHAHLDDNNTDHLLEFERVENSRLRDAIDDLHSGDHPDNTNT